MKFKRKTVTYTIFTINKSKLVGTYHRFNKVHNSFKRLGVRSKYLNCQVGSPKKENRLEKINFKTSLRSVRNFPPKLTLTVMCLTAVQSQEYVHVTP